MPLNNLEKKIISFIEEHFWEYQQVPTLAKIEDKFGTDVSLEFSKPSFREALHKKYLLVYYDTIDSSGLSPEQLLALNMVCNPDDKRSLRVKLNQCNLSSQQWAVWMNDPSFNRHFSGRLHRNFKGAMPEVLMAVVQQAIGGDVKAQTLYLEMSGAYTRSSNVNVNVDVGHTLDKLVEILQEELASQPALLTRIAERFEKELDAPSRQVSAVTAPLAIAQGFEY